jgi:hypothetical protein
LVHAPSLVIFDDLDNIISNPSDSADGRSQPSNSFTKYLTELIDEYKVSIIWKINFSANFSMKKEGNELIET